MKKIWLITIIVVIVVIYFAYEDLRPRYIEQHMKSIIYSTESNFEKQTDVKLQGNLYKSLFGQDVFIGELHIDENLMYEVKLKEDGENFLEILVSKDNDNKVLQSIGSVMTSKSLDRIWIQLNDINERYNIRDGYISGPAKNKEEGIEISRRIVEGTE